MTRWIIKKSQGFTNVGLLRLPESVRAYLYLILGLQASVGSRIIANTASALTAKKAFLNNFDDIVNRRVNIREDIKRYQDTSVMHQARSITAWEKIFIRYLVIRT